MRRRILHVALATGVSMAIVAACGGGSSGSGNKSASAPSAPTSAGGPLVGDPVKIGALMSLSGVGAAVGDSGAKAIKIAVDRLNQSGGVVVGGKSHKFDLTVVDDKTDTSAALAGATQLTVDKNIRFILGPIFSALAPSVAQAVTPKGVLVISDAAALDPLIAGDAVKTTGKLIFRTLPPNDVLIKILTGAMKQAFPDVKRVAFVLADDATGRGINTAFAQQMPKQGYDLVALEYVPNSGTDFQTVLTSIKPKNPELLYMCCTANVLTGLMRQSVELGIKARFGYASLAVSLALKDAMGKPVPFDTAVAFLPSVIEKLPSGDILTAKPGVKQFVADLQATGGTIDQNTAVGFGYFYDSIALLAAAMQKANSTDNTEAIAKALEDVTIQGANGTVGFGPTHAWNPPPDVCVVRASSSAAPECSQVALSG